MKRHRSAAFTLIELLVVITIIAILAALMFAMAPGIMKKGRQVQTLNNLKQIATGLNLYAADNDGRYPGRVPDGTVSDKWPQLVFNYLKEKKVYAAPDDPANYLKTKADPLSNTANNTSYIMNGGWDGGPEPSGRGLVVASIAQPTQTILLGVIFNDENFFLDVANNDQDRIKPDLFGTSNDYLFMDGSAKAMDAKEYRELNSKSNSQNSNAYLWLINK